MARKRKSSKPLNLAKVKKAARGITEIGRAQKKLDAVIKKHKKHLTAMFEHNW